MPKSKKLTPKELYWAKKNKEEQERAAYPPPGLINHGNTCFMNSVLQGFFATDLLRRTVEFLQSQDSSTDAPAVVSPWRSPLLTNGRGPKDVQQEWCEGLAVGDVFIRTLERAWSMRDHKDRANLSPKELLAALGQKYDQYLDFRQQDAHEFFIHLLDCMRMEEIDVIKKRQPPLPKKPTHHYINPDLFNEKSIPLQSISEEERLIPFVDMIWGGRFTSYLICTICKHVSQTYEDFDGLSLPIRHDESKERKRDRLRAFASRFMSTNGSYHWQNDFFMPRAQSQPPSPPLTATRTGEKLEDIPEIIRRRSFESTSMGTMTMHSLDDGVAVKPNEDNDALNVEKTREKILEEISSIATPASIITMSASETLPPDTPDKLTSPQIIAHSSASGSVYSSTITLPFATASNSEPWSKKVGERISRRISTSVLKSAKLGDMMKGTKDKVDKSDSEVGGGVAAALDKLTGRSSNLENANAQTKSSRLQFDSISNTSELKKTRRHSSFLLHHRRERESRRKTKVPGSEREALEATYLTRILLDITATYSSPLHSLTASANTAESSSRSSLTNSSGSGSGLGMYALMSQLSRLNTGGANQSIEDCLRTFTAVEALDGENMFGCHNCWKIAHGKISSHRRGASGDESSDDEEVKNSPSPEIIPRPPSRTNTGLSIQSVDSINSAASRSTVFAQSSDVGLLIQKCEGVVSDTSEKTAQDDDVTVSLADSPASPHTQIRKSSVDSPASSTSLNSADSGSAVTDMNMFSSSTSVSSDKALTICTSSGNAVENGDSEATLGSVGRDIPTIAMTMSSPIPPEEMNGELRDWIIPVPMFSGITPDAKDVLGLPERTTRAGHSKDGFSSESSMTSASEDEQCEVSDTSSVSALAKPPSGFNDSNSPRRTRSATIPKSQQVIYRRALKRYFIADPPRILVIHLKRFQQVSKSSLTLFGNFKKLDDYVSFPEYLDLRPFLAPRKEDYGLGKGEMEGKIAEKGTRAEDKPCICRLYAVIVHIGNLLGGHYIAYTALPPSDAMLQPPNMDKDKDKLKAAENGKHSDKHLPSQPSTQRQWCYISDTEVRLVSLNEVLKAKAYLCMYERIVD